MVMVTREPFPLWVACGNDEDTLDRWTVFVVAEPELLQRLFKRVDPTPAVAALEARIDDIVRSDSRNSDVEWVAAQ